MAKNSPVVYVPNMPMRLDPATRTEIPRIDLTPAMQHGQIVVLSQSPAAAHPDNIGKTIQKIEDRLEKEWQPNDFLLVAGDPVLFASAYAFISGFGYSTINVLRWDIKKKTYDVLKLEITWE